MPQIENERRRHKRANETFTVYYASFETDSGDYGRWDISRSKDISAGGIRFTSKRRFPDGSYIRVRMNVNLLGPDGKVECTCQIVRSNEIVPGILCENGARFTDIDPVKQRLINMLIEANHEKQCNT